MTIPHRLIFSSLAIIALLTACVESPRQRTGTLADQKVDSLLALMSIEEKIGQLNMYNGRWEFTGPAPSDAGRNQKYQHIKNGMVGSLLNVYGAKQTRAAQELAVNNSRLGIPLIFGYDVIHGYKTIFPIPLAQASSWDLEVARKGAEVAALEASSAGLHWTFAPMIDVSRDARWGRIMEGAGEDPYLTSAMTKAWIDGFQGADLSSEFTIAACAKHFAAYGFAEGGRDYNTAEISKTTLHNVVMPPFKAAVEAGVATLMNAFNDINGIPATGSTYLQRNFLKGKWGFGGFVVSDWGSIGEMVRHGYAEDSLRAAEIALTAGSDMDMESKVYLNYLKSVISSDPEKEALLDDAVSRILKVKFQLGLFDDPYKYCSEDREQQNTMTPANLQASEEAATKSIVLLKNQKALLPLSMNLKSIAVIGSLASSKDDPIGNWRAQGEENSAISLLEGIRAAVSPNTVVSYAPGYFLTEGRRGFGPELTFVDDDGSGFGKAIQIAAKSEVVIMSMGEDCYQSAEGRSQADIGLKGRQEELLKEILKANENVIVVLSNGRPLAIPEVAKSAPGILETWFLGSRSGHAIARVIFGDYNPAGKLPVSFPYHSGQEPLYYNKKSTGRPGPENGDSTYVFWSHYTDIPNRPLFPFGFGLSYTTFEYSSLEVTAEKSSISVSVDVTNTGKLDGEETVQLYIRDLRASVIRPIKELKGFQKLMIRQGETVSIQFNLTKEDLSFYTEEGDLIFEPGKFKIMVGGNSEDLITKMVMFN